MGNETGTEVPNDTGLSLSKEIQDRIRAEEVYRSEVRESLEEPSTPWSRFLDFSSRPIVLWVLTITVGALFTSGLERRIESGRAEAERQRETRRVLAELKARYESHLQWTMIQAGRIQRQGSGHDERLKAVETAEPTSDECTFWFDKAASIARPDRGGAATTIATLSEENALETLSSLAFARASEAKEAGYTYAHACLRGLYESVDFALQLRQLSALPPQGGIYEEFRSRSLLSLLVEWATLIGDADERAKMAFGLSRAWASLEEAPRVATAKLSEALLVLNDQHAADGAQSRECMRAFAPRVQKALYELRGYAKKVQELGAFVEKVLGVKPPTETEEADREE